MADTSHLFYKFYPDSIVWGPMQWGHATISDMINWKERPTGIYSDSIGAIFPAAPWWIRSTPRASAKRSKGYWRME